jgi:hypothetical protein
MGSNYTRSTIGGFMINSIRQQAIVGKGGRIEIISPQLPIGATVEIIVLIDEPIKHVSQANTTLTPKPSNQKTFTIRQFSLGEEVNVVRDELYGSHRGASKMEAYLCKASKELSWDDFFDQSTVFGDDFLAKRENLPPQTREFF